MATIVFIPYPETGHINASFKVARSLKERGHRIYYLGLKDFEANVRRQNFEYLTILEDLCPKGFIQQHAVLNNIDNFVAIIQQAERQRKPLNLPRDIGAIMQRVRPDLFVIDLLLTDIAFSVRHSGVPLVLLNTQLFNPWKEDEGYRPLMDHTELILCPQEFDFPGTERKKDSYYVESSIDLKREDAPFPWETVAQDKPLIYCSFGSQSHLIDGSRQFFQAVIDATAARPDWQLILTTGSLSATEFKNVPTNAILVKTAPQIEVLQKASIMITHGGFNSVKECIYFNVSMICFPVIRDHPAIAARVAYHGLGLSGDIKEATSQLVESLIDRIINDASYNARMTAMSKIFRETEAASPSVQVIEKVITTGLRTFASQR